MREELLKIAKPILFNTEMVQAILDNRKTVTRRVIKPKYKEDEGGFSVVTNKATGERWVEKHDWDEGSFDNPRYVKPPYRVGDILYIKETFANTWIPDSNNIGFIYKADGKPDRFPYWGNVKQCKDEVWIPSIHMPKSAARIFLKVTNIRVEILQDITKDYNNFNKEGIIEEHGFRSEMHGDFIKLWNSTIKKQDLDKYGWEANPWIWVIEFEKIEEEI